MNINIEKNINSEFPDFDAYSNLLHSTKNVAELISFCCAAYSEKIAIISSKESLTYRQFFNKANALAKILWANGVSRGDHVALFLNRSIESILSIYAILLCGAAYVPIETNTPIKRVQYILQDSIVKLAIVDEAHYSVLSKVNTRLFVYNEADLEMQGSYSIRNYEYCDANDLIYILYTSGSTGNPKGVMISQDNALYYLRWVIMQFKIANQDTFDFSSPLSFDFSVTCTLLPLTCGATISICDEKTKVDLLSYLSYLSNRRISFIKLTPGYFNKLSLLLKHTNSYALDNLRWIFLGGEACIAEDIRLWLRLFPLHQIVNEYGPTEITVAVTAYIINSNNVATLTQDVPIGYVAPEAEVYILDECKQLISATKLAGEIYVSGKGLARGYLNQPAMTEQKFIDWLHPVTKQILRIYKTGDQGMWIEPGLLIYLGRKEQYVKVRGFRVEIAEIENIINKVEGIKKSIVAVDNNENLICFIQGIASSDQLPSVLFRVKEMVKQCLPYYMCPSKYQIVEDFPLNPNGKIDRLKLLNILVEKNDPKIISIIQAKSERERQFGLLCAKVLKVKKIDLDRGFLELGGHSLLAMELVLLTRSDLKLNPSITRLLENDALSKVLGLAEILEVKLGSSEPSIGLLKAPLSFQQRSVFLLENINQSGVYNVSARFNICGQLNLSALRKAIQFLFSKHKQLTINITSEAGITYQRINQDFDLPYEQLVLGIDLDEKALEDFIQSEFTKKFDLERQLPIRVKLIICDCARYILLISWHHSITDEWSSHIFFSDLETYYIHFLSQDSLPATIEENLYFGYSKWQSLSEFNIDCQRGIAYWKQKLQTSESTINLPYAYPVKPNEKLLAQRYQIRLSKNYSMSVKRFCAKEEITPFCWFLSLYQLILMSFSGEHKFNIGIPFANRDFEEYQQTIGFFANTLPYPVSLDAKLSFLELIRQTKTLYLTLFNYQYVPFEMLVESCAKNREFIFNPLFQVMFVYQDKTWSNFQLPGIEISAVNPKPYYAKLPLIVFVYEDAGAFNLVLEYASNLFDKKTIASAANLFKYLGKQALSKPNLSLSEFKLVGGEETWLAGVYKGKRASYPKNLSLMGQFKTQVMRNPTHTALEMLDSKISYQELDNISNNIALWLQQLGIRSQHVVVIALPRSFEHICCMLAIVKIGATYCPVDPAYPKQRMLSILNDCKPALVLIGAEDLEKMKYPFRFVTFDKKTGHLKQPAQFEYVGDASAPAYIMYSSGSTGAPKGISIPQKGILRLVVKPDYIKFRNKQRIAHCANPYFDASTFEIWSALLNGATLVISAKTEFENIERIKSFISKKIDILWLTKSLFDELCLHDVDMFGGLEYLLIGGEALDPVFIKKVLNSKSAPRHLLNGYGPTENTTFTCVHKISQKDLLLPSVPIGKPIAHTDISIVDSFNRLLPWGFQGELLIAGDGLAERYINNADLTQAKFVCLALVGSKRERWYRSGDTVRINKNGQVEYIGRLDTQVKIRGFRVELSEIEAFLLSQPKVMKAYVLYLQGNLIAFILTDTKTDKSNLIAELSKKVIEYLPSYERPDNYIFIESIPLTDNGKIDIKGLREMTRAGEGANAKRAKLAGTDTERKLLNIWSEVLENSIQSVDLSFFEMGGNSIKLLKLAYEIEKGFNCTVALAELLKYTSIKHQATLLDAKLNEKKPQEEILMIQEGQKAPPLYLIHPSSGQSLCYQVLANRGLSMPVYAISDPYYFMTGHQFESLSEMAEIYANMIASQVRAEDLILGGWSFGGLAAIEVARKLKEKGKNILKVIMLDSYGKYNKFIYQNIKRDLEKQILKSSDQFIKNKLAKELQNLSFAVQSKIRSYDGEVHLIKAKEKGHDRSDELTNFMHPLCGWSLKTLPKLTISYSRGTHQSLLKSENIEELIEALVKIL